MINWFCHMYPYSNLHELNLDWVIDTVKQGEKEIADFIGVNTIKYANPILWNIESQYEANTVVVDGQTGNAYISVKAVPSGVHLNREEYWTQIYNYANVVDSLREQIAYNEGESTTATRPYAIDNLVFVNGVLFHVIAPMIAGDSFVANSNVVQTTINEEIARLHGFITDEASARESADTQLQANIEAEASARESTDNTLQANINAEATARENADVVLQANIDAVNTKIGNLSDLYTTDKSSVVNAINEITAIARHGVMVNVKDFGAIGDGINNDYYAIKDAMDYAKLNKVSIIYFPNGEYNCAGGRFEIDSSKFTFMGAEKARLNSTGLADGYFIKITSPVASDMGSFARVPLMNITINGNYFTDRNEDGVIGVQVGTDDALVAPHLAIYNVTITRWGVGLQLASAYKSSYFNCAVIACNRGIQVPAVGIQQAVPCTFTSCYVECCHIAFHGLGGGYNSVIFYGGAFEYNRSVLSTCTKVVFYGTRFEHDVLASCDQNKNQRAVYSGFASSGSSTTVKFIGCFFLGLNNFTANVGFWIANPYVLDSYSGSPMYFVGGTDVSLEMLDCELVDVYYPTATYYIACDKFRGHGNYTNNSIPNGNIIGSVSTTETNGFIS